MYARLLLLRDRLQSARRLNIAIRMGCWTYFFLNIIIIAERTFAQRPLELQTEELPVKLQVGYAVRVLDVNADQKLDIAIVDSKRVLWLENPNWNEHVIYETPQAKFDNVCFAPWDINGDGKVDFALGSDWQVNNTESGGSIGWLENQPQATWKYHPISQEPTTHRMVWANLASSKSPELIVAPLKGRSTKPPGFDQTGLRLLAFSIPENPQNANWPSRVLTDQLHVMHNLEVVDFDSNQIHELLLASYEGVHWFHTPNNSPQMKRLGTGQEKAAPARGASEIRSGKLANGRRYIATVEPWHGDKIVTYIEPATNSAVEPPTLWPRFVLDEQLAWGHAIAIANLDGDLDDELIVGIRDDQNAEHRRGVRVYDPQDPDKGIWTRILVDAGGVAVEDLVVDDLDKNGKPDIVAVGRATHNAKIYWNR